MSYEIIFLQPAAEELEAAVSWYEDKKRGLGFDFMEEVEEYLNLIQDNPHLFQEHKNKSNLHKVPLIRFPYSIIYWIVEQEKVVYIDAVFHSKRNSKFK